MENLKINREANLSHKIFNLFFNPLIIGLYGFAIFFGVLLGTKAIALFLESKEAIVVEMDDIWLSLWGFGFYFIIKLIMNIKKRIELTRPQAFKLSDKVKNLI